MKNWIRRCAPAAAALACLVLAQARASPLESVPSEPESHVRTKMPPDPFSVDGKLRRNVDFWIKIYSQYTTDQGLIHDSKHVDKVYEVLDFKNSSLSQTKLVKNAKARWKGLLLSVHRKQDKPESMTDEEQRIYRMYLDVDESDKFLAAAHRKRLRFQLGQRDRFVTGLYESGRYLAVMEEIFRREGLPIELTRLPFVESSFNVRARSKVGASGIWQFMRSTGKLFMRVNPELDERNDPIRATEAAAKLLRGNYESLGTWPLAVTAYNHGRKGMMRAVRDVGTEDIEEVVEHYRSRTFGFASSNFFTELLAAIEVERNAEKYFGPVARAAPIRSYEVEIPDRVKLKDIALFLQLELDTIRELNPALTEAVLESKKPIPRGYVLRLPLKEGLEPDSAARIFKTGYNLIPSPLKRN